MRPAAIPGKFSTQPMALTFIVTGAFNSFPTRTMPLFDLTVLNLTNSRRMGLTQRFIGTEGGIGQRGVGIDQKARLLTHFFDGLANAQHQRGISKTHHVPGSSLPVVDERRALFGCSSSSSLSSLSCGRMKLLVAGHLIFRLIFFPILVLVLDLVSLSLSLSTMKK